MISDSDAEMRQMAQDEITRLEPGLMRIEQELKVLLLPKDPNDEKNVVLEIRAGTGGDEATLFAGEIFRMYSRYAEAQRWRVEVTSASESAVGGLKEVIALVSGDRVYSQLKYESGVHRVQRVPQTEQQGASTPPRLPWLCCPKPTRWSRDRGQGCPDRHFLLLRPGGQSVEHDVLGGAHHASSHGTVVSCQDEKSQIKNQSQSDARVRSRLYEIELEKQREQMGRAAQHGGTGDRSEKSGRTIPAKPRDRSPHRADAAPARHGDGRRLDPIVDALTTHYQTEKLGKRRRYGLGLPILRRAGPIVLSPAAHLGPFCGTS